MTGERIRVVVVDHQEFARAGIRVLLGREQEVAVVGDAENGPEALDIISSVQPHVVMVDSALPPYGGLDFCRKLLERSSASLAGVIIITEEHSDELLLRAVRAGARGYILKNSPAWSWSTALRSVASGDAFLAGSVTSRVFTRFTLLPGYDPSNLPKELSMLNDRELQVFKGIAKGLFNREIARLLAVSESTVKACASKIIGKLGVRNRVEIALVAFRLGLASPSPVRSVDSSCRPRRKPGRPRQEIG
ncbi:response regulator [Streptomyces sp. NPDC127097]|uniref:response regulator n=1 Tax=Streptomyces sp. NPDC127097 TaxID=3347136 RepID=UPI003657EB16